MPDADSDFVPSTRVRRVSDTFLMLLISAGVAIVIIGVLYAAGAFQQSTG